MAGEGMAQRMGRDAFGDPGLLGVIAESSQYPTLSRIKSDR
jgi:hypothetical protein